MSNKLQNIFVFVHVRVCIYMVAQLQVRALGNRELMVKPTRLASGLLQTTLHLKVLFSKVFHFFVINRLFYP